MPRELSSLDKARLEAMPSPISEPDLYLNAVLYGDAGRHKTVTACSLGRTLLLAADPGWVSVKNHPDIWKNTEVMPFVGFRQLEALSLAFYHQTPPYDVYDSFVIDTIAFIQENYVDDLLRAGKFNKDTRPKFEIKNQAAARDLVIEEIPGRDDYHAAKNILRGPIRTLNKAPVNVIYLAHEREPSQDEKEKGYRLLRPDVTEALYKIIFRDAHLVGRTSKDSKGNRIIDFNGNDSQSGKSRITSLNDRKILAEKFPEHIKAWQDAKWESPSFSLEGSN